MLSGKINLKKEVIPGTGAQAIVEFAIVLPILLMVIVGVLEVGRMIFIYSAVTNASRNAARYASAYGWDVDPDGHPQHKFKYCDGIRNAAIRSAFLVSLSNSDIEITYDDGPPTFTDLGECNVPDGEADVIVDTGDRVTVTITTEYKPMLKLIPLTARAITSSSSRTILGVVEIQW